MHAREHLTKCYFVALISHDIAHLPCSQLVHDFPLVPNGIWLRRRMCAFRGHGRETARLCSSTFDALFQHLFGWVVVVLTHLALSTRLTAEEVACPPSCAVAAFVPVTAWGFCPLAHAGVRLWFGCTPSYLHTHGRHVVFVWAVDFGAAPFIHVIVGYAQQHVH